jgi:hypothetical protein
LFGGIVVAGGLVALTPAAQTITIPVACSENALVTAVTLINSGLIGNIAARNSELGQRRHPRPVAAPAATFTRLHWLMGSCFASCLPDCVRTGSMGWN